MVLKITEFFAHLWVPLSALIGAQTASAIAIDSAIILSAAFVVLQVISYIIGRKAS